MVLAAPSNVKPVSNAVASTRKTGGSTGGYKPLLLKASVSRRWLSLRSSHCAFHTSRIPKGISPSLFRGLERVFIFFYT